MPLLQTVYEHEQLLGVVYDGLIALWHRGQGDALPRELLRNAADLQRAALLLYGVERGSAASTPRPPPEFYGRHVQCVTRLCKLLGLLDEQLLPPGAKERLLRWAACLKEQRAGILEAGNVNLFAEPMRHVARVDYSEELLRAPAVWDNLSAEARADPVHVFAKFFGEEWRRVHALWVALEALEPDMLPAGDCVVGLPTPPTRFSGAEPHAPWDPRRLGLSHAQLLDDALAAIRAAARSRQMPGDEQAALLRRLAVAPSAVARYEGHLEAVLRTQHKWSPWTLLRPVLEA